MGIIVNLCLDIRLKFNVSLSALITRFCPVLRFDGGDFCLPHGSMMYMRGNLVKIILILQPFNHTIINCT